jgi:hypothetical protein
MTVVRQEQNVSVKFSLLLLVCCAALFATDRVQAQESTPSTSPSSSAPATSPTTPAAAAPAAAPTAAPTWSVGLIDFSGLVDGYYNFNANHPATSSYGNQLRNFDYDANAFSLSMAKLTLSHDADPIGFRVDLGFGKTFDAVFGTDHLEQAYISWKPTKGKGFEADLGEFVTSAGAEVIETKDNWNYSRSILFAYALPYYHVGLRTSMPITKSFTAGVQVVNGWNNFFSDNNSGKTIGITGVYTKPKFVWAGNYYTGPENPGTNKGFRNLFDTTLTLTPTAKFSAYINYDYVQNRDAAALSESSYVTTGLDHLSGVAFAARYQATDKIAFAGRAEYVADKSDFGATVGAGTRQNLNEFTLTAEYKVPEGLLARLEYRRDGSDEPYFNKGTSLAVAKGQSTLEVGVTAFFGPKR